MELLNQMDGFDQTVNVKVIMATNRADTLDPALLRPGRLDRKIEFPLPDRRQKRLVFQVHVVDSQVFDTFETCCRLILQHVDHACLARQEFELRTPSIPASLSKICVMMIALNALFCVIDPVADLHILVEMPMSEINNTTLPLQACTAKMNLSEEVDLEDYVGRPDKISNAEISAICQEAGMHAVRKNRQVYYACCYYISVTACYLHATGQHQMLSRLSCSAFLSLVLASNTC